MKPESKRSLVFSLKADDSTVRWEYFPAGKNGGQKGNKTASACRVTHLPSGAKGESREQRSQLQNRRIAWKRMVDTPVFRGWLALHTTDGPTPEAKVEQDMQDCNLLVEIKQDGKWVDEKTI